MHDEVGVYRLITPPPPPSFSSLAYSSSAYRHVLWEQTHLGTIHPATALLARNPIGSWCRPHSRNPLGSQGRTVVAQCRVAVRSFLSLLLAYQRAHTAYGLQARKLQFIWAHVAERARYRSNRTAVMYL